MDDAIAGGKSVFTTFAFPAFTFSASTVAGSFFPFTVLASVGDHIACHDLARDHMVGKNRPEPLFILSLE